MSNWNTDYTGILICIKIEKNFSEKLNPLTARIYYFSETTNNFIILGRINPFDEITINSINVRCNNYDRPN